MIETVGFISQGLAAFGDVELWLGAALLLGTGAGLWRMLKPATATAVDFPATTKANDAASNASSVAQEVSDVSQAETDHFARRAEALAEIAETKRLIQLGGVDGAASELLRIMWHWPWWAEQQDAVNLPVEGVSGSETILPYSGVVRRKRIDWRFADRQFTLILEEQEPTAERCGGELCLLVDAELRLRLDMRRGEDPFGAWLVAGVSLCRSDGWVAAFMDCARAVRSSEPNIRQAFERALFGDAGPAFASQSARPNGELARPNQANSGSVLQGEGRRRLRKAREIALSRQAPLSASPFGSYPGLAVTFAPPPSVRKPQNQMRVG